MTLTLQRGVAVFCHLVVRFNNHYSRQKGRTALNSRSVRLSLPSSVVLSFSVLFIASSSFSHACCFSSLNPLLSATSLAGSNPARAVLPLCWHAAGWGCCVNLPSAQHGFGREGEEEEERKSRREIDTLKTESAKGELATGGLPLCLCTLIMCRCCISPDVPMKASEGSFESWFLGWLSLRNTGDDTVQQVRDKRGLGNEAVALPP